MWKYKNVIICCAIVDDYIKNDKCGWFMNYGSLLVERNENARINDMEIYEMSFSPTGGTRRVADVLAAA